MTRLLSFLLAAFLIVPVIAQQPPAQTPAPVKHSDDDRIYDEVRRKLANDLDVKGAGIEVAVQVIRLVLALPAGWIRGSRGAQLRRAPATARDG